MTFERLEEFANDDPVLAGSLVDLFLEQTPEFLEQIDSTLQKQDAQEAKTTIHTFKGVCLNLGFNNLADLCQQMEQPALDGKFEDVLVLLSDLKIQYTTLEKQLNSFQKALMKKVSL